MPRLLLYLLALALTAAATRAATVDRVLRNFDFEERAAGNVEDIPMDWQKVEGPGFPHYVNGTLATDQANSGRYSFRFDLNGGNVAYRYPAGKIPVHAGAHYLLSVMAKTQDLVNARAQLTAFCVDAAGNAIKASITRSEPLRSTADVWTPLTVELTAPETGAWLVPELRLVQGPLWNRTTPGDGSLFEQDITGHAWFDDLSIRQVPRLKFDCSVPGNIFRQGEPVVLNVQLNDRLTNDLVGRLAVVNAEGKLVYQRTDGFDLAATSDVERSGRLVLPALPAGWYRAQVAFDSGGTPVGAHTVDFVCLADDGATAEPDPRFGVVASRLPFAAWPQLPEVLPYLGVSRVKLSVWSEAGDAETAPGLDFDRLLDRLRQRQITPTGCFTGVPPRVASLIGGNDWQHLVAAKPDTWQPQFALFTSRYAGQMDRWQFGFDEQAQQFVTSETLRKAYGQLFGPMKDLFNPPDLAMPWPAWFDTQPTTPPNVALSVPTDVLPQQLPTYVQDVRRAGRPNAALSIQTLDDRYGRQAMLRDLAQRIGYAVSSEATRIDLPLPFRQDEGPSCGQPTESFLVLRTLLSTLAGTTYQGHLPIDPDVEALLFDRGGEGIVLLWTSSAQGGQKTVPVMLGRSPRTVDLFGNVSPILKPKAADGTTDVVAGPLPSLLIGIDGALARLRAGFMFDNPLIESAFKPHVRRLKFTNPYPTPISGRFKLTGPNGWSLVAQQPEFTLAPGQSYDGVVTIEFPYHSLAGVKPIICDVQLDGEQSTAFKVPLSLKLGLGDVGMTTTAFRDGADLVVQQMITNYGTKPIDYTAFISCTGIARQERLISGLAPGATVIKKFRLSGVDLTTKPSVHSGVRETEGTRVLTDEVAVQ